MDHPPTPDICRLLEERGKAYASLGTYEKARFEFQGALNAAQALHNPSRECALLIELGVCESQLEPNQEKARKCYQAALAVYTQKELQDSVLKARLLANLGNAELQTGHFDQAVACYQEAILLAKSVGSTPIYRNALMTQGAIAAVLEDWSAALGYFQEAMAIPMPPQQNYQLWENLGYCYIQVGQYEAAQEILQQLLKIVATIENKTTASRCFFKLGFAAELQGDLTAAMSHYQTSYSTHPYPEPLIGLARIYSRQQKRDLAQLMAEDGQQLLAAEPFSPLFDFTLEWNTLLDLRGTAALAGAHQWILKMLTSLPPTVDYWRSAARRQLIQSVREFGTLS